MPCPICGGAFPKPASLGMITCENGHDFTMATLPGAMELFEEMMTMSLSVDDDNWTECEPPPLSSKRRGLE
jgi:hypothetical protein